MKNLDDFLSEDKKKKSKPHATKKGAGADDKKYVTMMEEYKRLRRTDREAANELLKKAAAFASDAMLRTPLTTVELQSFATLNKVSAVMLGLRKSTVRERARQLYM